MRVTSQVAAEIRRRLSPVDWAIAETLDRVDIASAGQLRRLHWPEPSQARTARRRLSQLTDLRVISRLDRRVGGVRAGSEGFVYRLDVTGRRLLGLAPGRRPHTPGRTFLEHSLAITEVYVRAVETSRVDLIEVTAFETEPSCWRTWGAGLLKPDAYLVTVTPDFEDHWFVEVDRATESTTTIVRKAAVYEQYHRTGIEQERHGVFPRVLWIVPHERRKNQIVDALGIRPADAWSLHQVALESDIPNIFNP
ncbi:MAG: replication-relaxation family protein [Acidimicrobiia bacterium]